MNFTKNIFASHFSERNVSVTELSTNLIFYKQKTIRIGRIYMLEKKLILVKENLRNNSFFSIIIYLFKKKK